MSYVGKTESNNQIFGKETFILNKSKALVNDPNLTLEAYKKEYISLCNNYEKLLGEAKVLTSVGDRLHARLDTANKNLKNQAEEINEINKNLQLKNQLLKDTIDQLIKAKIGKKASTIVLLIAICLFIVSEGVLEPWVESFTDSPAVGFFFKGIIALLLKPIDMVVERFLMKKSIKQNKIELSGEVV